MIEPRALIEKFRYALDDNWGYIYGKVHEMWTEAKQAEYVKDYSGDPNRQNSCKYGGQWAGHWVTDCSGLFTWAFNELGGKMYHGSNTMYRDWCTTKGKLTKGKRSDGKELLPGTAVFTGTEDTHNHVGLYVGNGTVIEAQGAKAGVTTTKVTNSKWTYWGELKGVDYNASPEPQPTPAKGTAVVTGTRVALRQGCSTQTNVILRVDTGETVKIEDIPTNEWEYVSYKGKTGFMMKEFLKEG